MNLYRRTFSVLLPFWKQLLIASISAAAHALTSGAMVWMLGPLMMTLFQVDSLAGLSASDIGLQEQITTETVQPEIASGFFQSITDATVGLKESMKNWIDTLVAAETRQETLVKFCWLILLVVLAKNLFLYLQGFFMAFVQQSVIRSLRDRLFE
ncbi:MAG: hypothetical protein KAU36_09185, partial [candidate division Zixibacteria bacterium]|nr:hypothetical protein [candidate division Zixibacteria bacterium]